MPGCVAIDCSNSAKKGFLMKKFPKDPLRRKEWLIKTKRDNWKPTDYSCLCEVHFAPEMWEKTRVDGTRKLRSSAVPTLFSFKSSITKNNRRSSAKINDKGGVPVVEVKQEPNDLHNEEKFKIEDPFLIKQSKKKKFVLATQVKCMS